jgi:hypothetical protein
MSKYILWRKGGQVTVFSPGSYPNGRSFAVAQAVKRIARNVSQQGVAPNPAAMSLCKKPLERSGTNVLLGRPSGQGEGKTFPIARS